MGGDFQAAIKTLNNLGLLSTPNLFTINKEHSFLEGVIAEITRN